MPNQVIWIVVAISVALLVFFVAGGMLGTSKVKLTDLLKWVGWQKEELGGAKTMEAACRVWLDGADKYSAKAILEKYAITDKSVPFSTLACCSQDLKATAEDNVRSCGADPTSPECNRGNIPMAKLQECWSACQAILQMEQSCRSQCPSASEAQISGCIAAGIEDSASVCFGVTAKVTCG